jgi:hypothetical protein
MFITSYSLVINLNKYSGWVWRAGIPNEVDGVMYDSVDLVLYDYKLDEIDTGEMFDYCLSIHPRYIEEVNSLLILGKPVDCNQYWT